MPEKEDVPKTGTYVPTPTAKEQEAMLQRNPVGAEARKAYEEERAREQAEAAARSPQVRDAK